MSSTSPRSIIPCYPRSPSMAPRCRTPLNRAQISLRNKSSTNLDVIITPTFDWKPYASEITRSLQQSVYRTPPPSLPAEIAKKKPSGEPCFPAILLCVYYAAANSAKLQAFIDRHSLHLFHLRPLIINSGIILTLGSTSSSQKIHTPYQTTSNPLHPS